MAQQMGDRGMITINEARELINYVPLPPEIGDQLPIRGEYYFVGEGKEPEEPDPEPEELPEPSEDTNPEPPEEGEENVDQE